MEIKLRLPLFLILASVGLINGCSEDVGPEYQVNSSGDLIMGHKASLLANNFYEHVFKDQKDRPRVAVYSHWDRLPPENFKGVHIFLDGESRGLSKRFKKNLNRMVYIGPSADTGARKSFYMPYASLHFAERSVASPLDLLKPPVASEKPFFAAYLASNCDVPTREKLYNQLVELAEDANLGEVHALGACYGKYQKTKRTLPSEDSRFKTNFLDSAVENFRNYQFVLTSENAVVDGYVTEKPVSALLAGAIPIYYGSKAILDRGFLNGKSIVFIEGVDSFKRQVLEVAMDDAKKREMLSVPALVSEDQLYLYSWHRDVAALLHESGRGTLMDLLHASVKDLI